MKTEHSCVTHPTRKALSFCHSCGRYFCSDCLVESEEFYYCKDETCQNKLRQEKVRILSEPKAQANIERANLKQRFVAIMIDYIIFALIFLATILVVGGTIFIADVDKVKIVVLVTNFLFFLKDSTGQSPGKKLLGIKIVRKSDLSGPNIMLPLIRNLFLCLGIIEVIVILFAENHERLGDKVTETVVVKIK
jgi:uncharacterized RDD family membrane protein YckC